MRSIMPMCIKFSYQTINWSKTRRLQLPVLQTAGNFAVTLQIFFLSIAIPIWEEKATGTIWPLPYRLTRPLCKYYAYY